MTPTALTIVAVYGLVVLFWVGLHVIVSFYSPRRFFVGRQSPRLRGHDGPLVSILLAAKDEAGNIGDCVRSILQSEYKNFELWVIDDRSQDGTAAEVVEAAAGDPRIHLLRIRELPPGWTGKMNAVRQGLARARGEVILIMDADTRHRPATLGTAVAALVRSESALLSLLPRFEHRTFFSKIVQPMVGALVCFWKPPFWINSRKRSTSFAWGGFLLIRRDALDAVGGLEAVKDCFAADIALASLIKRSRRRIRVYHAPKLLSTFMYTTVSDMVRGWTRLLRLTVDNRAGQLGLTLAALNLLALSAYAAIGFGLIGSGWLAQTIGAMGALHLILQLVLLARLYRVGGNKGRYALAHLPSLLTTCYLTTLALIRCRSNQLSWRGTQYRLQGDGRAS